MSGHSKWATTKRKKAVIDGKRAAAFTKIIRELTVAARIGGGDVDSNARLRLAVEKSKAVNMPLENMERAIARGAGTLEGVNYEEMTYEGYGSGGVALMIETLSDNKTRTVGDLRHMLVKYGGNLAESGAVGWNFERKGIIIIEKGKLTEDSATELALEIGADDVKVEEETCEFYTTPPDFEKVQKDLKAKKLVVKEASLAMVPKNLVAVSGHKAESLLKMLDALDENDDVQNVYGNYDIPDEDLKKFAES